MSRTKLKVLVFFLFALEYCTCVTDLYAYSGSFTSPNYPYNYPSDIERSWIIHVASGNSITLTFQTFNLESNAGCSYDYVEVRENNALGTSRTGKLCGTGISRTVRSSTSLYIVFHTDSSGQYSGFRADYVQSAGSTSQYCSFTYTSGYCDYGCCYSTSDCCTYSYSSSSSGSSWSSWSGSSWSSWSGSSWSSWSGSSWSSWSSSSYDDNGSDRVKGWLIGVIVTCCALGLSFVTCIICCIVKAAKSSTRTMVVHPTTAQPSVTVVSSAQQGNAGTSTAQPGTAYPNYYSPPYAVPPPYYYNNAAYPPQATAETSEK